MRRSLVTGAAILACCVNMVLAGLVLGHAFSDITAGRFDAVFYLLETGWVSLWIALAVGTYVRLRWVAALVALGLFFLSVPLEAVWFPPIAICLLIAVMIPIVWFPDGVTSRLRAEPL
jgi:hypothetical protein